MVGAQLGQPDRRVVAVMGDGSMNYAIAAHYGLPLTIVVLTNHEYAILKWFGELEQVSGIPGLDIPGINIRSLATGYGVPAHHITTTNDLTTHLERTPDGPVLLEIPISTSMKDTGQ